MKKLFVASNLSIQIGNQILVDGLDFSIDENETLAVVGESGSGKSLTALSLLGLLPPLAIVKADQLCFDQQSLLELDQRKWSQLRGQQIGMVFQEPQSSLNPTMRCGHQVAEVVKRHFPSEKNIKLKVLNTFEKVLLPQVNRIYTAYPHELSGGQKQRVMIAMALICEPKLLICDEPTTALDVTVQKEILTLFQNLQVENKMSILFISHDLGLVKSFADTVLVMRRGKIIEQAKIKALFDNPKNDYTKGLLQARPPLNIRPKRLITLVDYEQRNTRIEEETQEERSQRHQALYKQKPLLTARNLSKSYTAKQFFWEKKKSLEVLAPLDFEIYPGETLGLVGESGSGKSTLARCLSFLTTPTTGSVFFEGEALSINSAAAQNKLRKNIQYIFQDPFAALHPKITIGNMLTEVLQQYDHPAIEERIDELLNQVGLTLDMKKRYPHQLSGGQRQRAVIARALAPSPKLIICDEAVAALDISVQAQVLNLLNDLKNKLGLSYLFISHDMAVVRYMSDRILVLNQGQKETLQDADVLYKHPETPYTSKLIEAIL